MELDCRFEPRLANELALDFLGNLLRRHAASEHQRSHITLAAFQLTSH